MRLQAYIRLVETQAHPSILAEGKVYQIDGGYRLPVKVYRNPSPPQAHTLVQQVFARHGTVYLRGLMVEGKAVLVWDGWDLTHDDVLTHLFPDVWSGSSDLSTFEIDEKGIRHLKPGDYDPERNASVGAVITALAALPPASEPLHESTGRTLYHGTLRKFLPTILAHGLWPSVGEFTRSAYQEYEDAGIELDDLVFAADKQGLNRCVSAILGALAQAGMKDTPESFFRHAAIVVIREGGDRFRHRDDDSDEGHPTQVEPEDYYSANRVSVDYAITGDKLRSLLRKNDVHLDRFNAMDRGAANALLIRYASDDHPNERAALVAKVRNLSDQQVRDWLHHYQLQRIEAGLD